MKPRNASEVRMLGSGSGAGMYLATNSAARGVSLKRAGNQMCWFGFPARRSAGSHAKAQSRKEIRLQSQRFSLCVFAPLRECLAGALQRRRIAARPPSASSASDAGSGTYHIAQLEKLSDG